jgi:hypothetical protein
MDHPGFNIYSSKQLPQPGELLAMVKLICIKLRFPEIGAWHFHSRSVLVPERTQSFGRRRRKSLQSTGVFTQVPKHQPRNNQVGLVFSVCPLLHWYDKKV